MARLYANENFPLAAVEALRALGHDRKHFIRLHNRQPFHAGIIVCTFDPDFACQAHRIHAAMASQPSLSGQLIRVNRPADT